MKAYVRRLLKAAFPGQYDLIRDRVIQKRKLEKRKRDHEMSALPERPCHAMELFIRSDGGVYPCCLVWPQEHMRIGHIADPDIMEKIVRFNEYCYCERYKLRQMLSSESPNHELLYIELSLACQGKCALCCVNAPDWRKKYDYYPLLTKIIALLKPKQMVVQGGEVLIQKESMTWITEIKKKFTDMPMTLVTNGNVDLERVADVESLFSRVVVSFMAFNPESYEVITGMDVEKTRRFAMEILRRKRTFMVLKYIMTPSSIQETAAFVAWAVELHPNLIHVAESGILEYVKLQTSDQYWNKIIERSADLLKATLLEKADKMRRFGMKLEFYNTAARLLGFDAAYVQKNELSDIVGWWFK